MSLTDALVYAPKPSAVSGQKYRQSVPSYNKSEFLPGETIMLNIPCGRKNQFLNQRMSYLKFKLVNLETTTTDTIQLDYSGASLFSSFELYHGSQLLESIREYGALYTLWQDMVGSVEAMKHTGNLLEGCSDTFERQGMTLNGGAEITLCIPLLSGIIGSMQSKYLPTGDMHGDLRVELTLANANDGIIGAAARKWGVKQVTLELEYVELNSEAGRMISQQNAGVMSFLAIHLPIMLAPSPRVFPMPTFSFLRASPASRPCSPCSANKATLQTLPQRRCLSASTPSSLQGKPTTTLGARMSHPPL